MSGYRSAAKKKYHHRKRGMVKHRHGTRHTHKFEEFKKLSIERQIGVPERKRIRMRYCDNVQLTQTVMGVLTQFEYSTFNLFDPQTTLGGHKPMGYDQIVGVYYNYAACLGSKITVRFIQQSGSTSVPMACGIYPYNATLNSLSVQGYTNWRQFKEAGYPVRIIGTDKTYATASASWTYKLMSGVDPRASNQYWSTIGTGPDFTVANDWRYSIWYMGINSADTAEAITCEVTIDYIVEFFDRIPLTPS